MIRNLILIKSLGELWHGLTSVFKRYVGRGKNDAMEPGQGSSGQVLACHPSPS